ncbi:MAG: hypothetical protein J6D23_05680 [Clostridia bacterium]|nr:hypothetical protein [Clostridia bacterium]
MDALIFFCFSLLISLIFVLSTRSGFKNEYYRERNLRYAKLYACFSSIFLLAVGIAITIPLLDNGYFALTAISIIVVILSCIYIVLTVKKALLEEEESQRVTTQEETKRQKEFFIKNFYEDCLSNGIKHVNSPANRQKAILIANKMNYIKVSEQNIDSLFAESKNYVEGQKRSKEIEKMSQQRTQAQQLEDNKFRKYSNIHGRNKRIGMLQEKINSLIEDINVYKKYLDSLKKYTNVTKERELDWGTLGGIASAIGGVGAGIMVASDIQSENEKIKQRNDKRLTSAAEETVRISQEFIYPKEREISNLKAQIENAKIALIDESIDYHGCFELLDIHCNSDIDDNNILSVSAKVKLKNKMLIFDDVPAVVDGYLIAKVFIGEKEIGKSLLVLPLTGATNEAIDVSGKIILPQNSGKDKNYTLNIFPHALWAIERFK